jgi:hypothetical protein
MIVARQWKACQNIEKELHDMDKDNVTQDVKFPSSGGGELTSLCTVTTALQNRRGKRGFNLLVDNFIVYCEYYVGIKISVNFDSQKFSEIWKEGEKWTIVSLKRKSGARPDIYRSIDMRRGMSR